MRNFYFVFFCLAYFFILPCSCKLKNIFEEKGLYFSEAVEISEKQIIEEMKNPNDFSTHEIEAFEFDDYEYPEKLKWHSSYAASFGSPNAKQGGAFYTFIHDIPNTFRYCGPGSDSVTEKLFWNHIPLLIRSPEDKAFLPGAATHWAFSKDGKTVYYKLNTRAKWSDGKTCTAEDFIFAADFMHSKEIKDILYAPDFEKLSVKKINDFCIAVSFSGETFNSKELLLDSTNIKPRAAHFYGGKIPENWIKEFNRRPEPTTGAYYLDYYDFSYGLSFKKKENWWAHEYSHFKNMYNLDSIEIRILPGTQLSVRKYFRSGRLDSLPIVTADEWRNALDDARVKKGFADIWISNYEKPYGMRGLFFNTKKTPFDNTEVRRGMYYALDIDGMISAILTSSCPRLPGIGVNQNYENISFNNKKIKMPAYNHIKAAEIFAEAGYDKIGKDGIRINSNGQRLSFRILYDEIGIRDCMGYLYSQALKAGVELDFKFMSGGILNKVSQGDYQAWWGALPSSAIPANYNYLHSKLINTGFLNNVFAYSNTEMDKLLEDYTAAETLRKKAEINKQIEQLIFDEALFLPGYYFNCKREMVWKWIRFPGWINRKHTEDFADPFSGLMWFDSEIKKDCDEAMEGNFVFSTRYWFPQNADKTSGYSF